MATMHATIVIDAPPDQVWGVIAHRFDRVGEWATAIRASAASPGPALAGSPVAGRTCRTGVALVPEVTERITAYDDTALTLTYAAEGLPRFLGEAHNRWRVTGLDDGRSRVTVDARIHPSGVLGPVLFPALRLQLAFLSRRFLADLKHYVEHGEPSARKRRRLRGQGPR